MLQRLLLLATASSIAAACMAQCDVRSTAPPVPFHDPPVTYERGGAPLFIIPVVFHVYYSDVFRPVGTLRIPDLITQANLDLRGMNPDVADVNSNFTDIVGDLGVELRLATIDANGNCFSGILYHWYDSSLGTQPAYANYAMNTASYLNIHVMVGQNSYAFIPSVGMPPLGSLDDGIVFTSYDAVFRPRTLAHEVGHWVGLHHTFGDTNTSGVNCGDDGLADTPVTKGSLAGMCDTTLSICTPGVIENVDNFMDYSLCYKMFTLDQMAHVAMIMTDPTIPRGLHCTPENLAATGVFLPSTCAISADFNALATATCAGTTVNFRTMCEGQVPDQVIWSFPGGLPSTSTDAEPDVTYASSGSYTAQLIACYNGECDTVTHVLDATVLDPNLNGLPLYSPLPYAEDFENGFAFPQPNMVAVPSGTSTWQVCDFAGYASDHSLYIPAEVVYEADTNDLVLGNFDLTGLVQPTVSFKLAATYYDTCWFQTLDILFRDLCSEIYMGQFWATHLNPELTENNHDVGFAPTADDQWITMTTTFPIWNMATRAELVVRVRRPFLPSPPFHPEAIFLDDLTVGELDVSTAVPTILTTPSLRLFPNPATDHMTIAGERGALLRVTDVAGRLMTQERMSADRLDLDVSGWPGGSYIVSMNSQDRVERVHLVVP